jgi:predicted membrane-bound mannosyltransferase
LILAAISAALLFATKETAMISAAVLVIALIVTQVYRWLGSYSSGPSKKKKNSGNYSKAGAALSDFVEKSGGPGWLAIWSVIALAVFVAVNVLFYSSFFTNYPQGVYDSLKTFQFWTKTGKEAHVHPFATYVWWLLEQESPLLVLGSIGAILAVLRPVKSLALFSALWAFGLIAAYSLIAYKTPWLSLNFIIPLALSSGVAIEWIYEELGNWELSKAVRAAIIAGVLLVALGPLPGITRIFDEAVAINPWPGLVPALKQTEAHGKTFIPGYQTVDLNFINYDNDNRYYVYVYAHTRRETLKLLDEINKIAQLTHQGAETGITIVSPDYWPLPWYLRDYTRVGYHGRMTPSVEPIVIAKQEQAAEVQATFGDRYQQIYSGANTAGSFPLRPGVDLLLFTRRELVR